MEGNSDNANLSLSKDHRFIEVVVDQDVRLGRIVSSEAVSEVGVKEFDRKDLNTAKAKLEEAALSETLAEQNVERLTELINNPGIEHSG